MNLRDRILIQKLVTTPDDAGGSTGSWEDQVSCWADVTPKSGFRDFEGNKIELDNMYEIVMRYDDYPILQQTNRIIFENLTLVIHYIQNIGNFKRTFKIIARVLSEDNVLYDENFQPITNENNAPITT